MKDVRFFDKIALNADQINCYTDELCSTCSTNGECTACRHDFNKLSNKKCVCSKIENCDQCSSANICDKPATSKKINQIESPNKIVDACPSNTHESLGKCYSGLNYV